MSSDDIYQERILAHYEEPHHCGHCPGATHAHEDDNPLCGDVVRLELAIDKQNRVAQAWFNGDGCCISQAAASMLTEKIEGLTVEQIKQLSAADMLDLFGVKLTPNRQKCCLLAWRVLQAAIYSPLKPAPESGGGATS